MEPRFNRVVNGSRIMQWPYYNNGKNIRVYNIMRARRTCRRVIHDFSLNIFYADKMILSSRRTKYVYEQVYTAAGRRRVEISMRQQNVYYNIIIKIYAQQCRVRFFQHKHLQLCTTYLSIRNLIDGWNHRTSRLFDIIIIILLSIFTSFESRSYNIQVLHVYAVYRVNVPMSYNLNTIVYVLLRYSIISCCLLLYAYNLQCTMISSAAHNHMYPTVIIAFFFTSQV